MSLLPRLLLSSVAGLALALVSTLPSAALDIPRNVHRAKNAPHHLTETHSAGHRAAARSSAPAASHVPTGKSKSTKAIAASGKAVTRRGRAQRVVAVSRKHRSYERFT